MLPLLDAESATIHIEGLDKLGEVSHSGGAIMGEVIGLVAVLLIFGTPIVIVLAVLRSRTRRIEMQNEVILKLAERGQPIPPELFLTPQQRSRSELSSGLSLIGIGIGVALGLWFVDAHEAIGFALIPFFIGLARLVAWKLERREPTA